MDHQLVARRDHVLFPHPQTHRDRGVAVKRQALLIAHGGQEEVQKDGVARQSRGEVAQEATVDPGKTLRRRAAHAIGDQQMFLDHGREPPDVFREKIRRRQHRPYSRRTVLRATSGLRVRRSKCPPDGPQASAHAAADEACARRAGNGACCLRLFHLRSRSRTRAWPGGTRRHNTGPVHDRKDAGARNNQVGHKNREDFSCCVTTRAVGTPPQTGQRVRSVDRPLRYGVADDAVAGPPPVAAELRHAYVAAAGVWRLASDTATADTPAPGSSVGSTAGARTDERSPCEDTAAEGIEKYLPMGYRSQ